MRSLISWSIAERDVINRCSFHEAAAIIRRKTIAFIGASRSGEPGGYSNMRKQDYHVLALHIVEGAPSKRGSMLSRERIIAWKTQAHQ